MPKATTSISDTERKELRSCPGGYVVLRRMNYDEYLTRRDMVMRMTMQAERGKNMVESEMRMANRTVVEYEFQKCIVDHNLENEDGQLLDFRSGMTLSILDPRIGDEIAGYIDEMNQWEAEEGNSSTGSVEQ